ncbi:ribosomal protein S18-alanine N-acetyltransferase [Antrihabitans cavernicola]|uniref:Ribosomal-protein-alanine N-acetyltransferase n=1 Tax=Antrihabitans cavernicola TaxID=2495913 RepID=A0A5A7SA09_9NOCA|nr:ribosomal protein S18-alanine N-acetyltransferase [Spelaeibacter cavernicola]KAA0022746.1 ribosomal-protein-alanine N-acetyltransferase [Spelaeibacter cavernicola]
MTISIVAMTIADVERCVELENLLFPGDDPWSANAFRSELAGEHNRYLTARNADDEMIGYAGVALLGGSIGRESEVHTIGVDPAHQRLGAGRLLLDRLLSFTDEHGGPVFLEVRTDNTAAITLYLTRDFEIVGTRVRYYQPSGADAYTMRRPPAEGYTS